MEIFNQKLRVFLTVVLLLSCQILFAQQTFYVNSDIGDDLFDGMSSTDDGGGVGPFQTIQLALLIANDLDSIMVSDGEYFGSLIIDKSLVIIGANHSIDGDGSRNAESVLLPDITDLSTPANGGNAMVQVNTQDVVFSGFTINGDNPNVNSANNVNGADVDFAYGIVCLGEYDGVRLLYNRIININTTGIESLGNIFTPNRNCVIGFSLFNNLGDQSTGIVCGNGFYTDILDNRIDGVNNGIYIYDFTTAGTRPFVIQDNNINVRNIGILATGINSNASNLYIDGNDMNSANIGSPAFHGISIRDCSGNSNLEIRRNNISNYENGIFFINTDLPVKAMAYDTMDNCNVGLMSISAFQHMRKDSISFEFSSINESSQSAMEIFSDTTKTIMHMDNDLIKDCVKGILSAGNVELRPNTTTFEKLVSYYIQLDWANTTITNSIPVDATKCIFDGNTGATNTPTGNFDVENQIKHYLDDESFGIVTFHDSNLYISGLDGNSFIRRGIESSMDDYHVHVTSVVGAEDLFADKQLHMHLYGTVETSTLTLDASGKELFIHDTLTVADGLELNSGRLNTRDGLVSVGKILVTPGNTSVKAPGASYVDGPLEIVIQTTGSDTIVYPIGTNISSRPLQLFLENRLIGNWDKIRVSLEQGNTPIFPISNGISHVSDIHYWDISSSNNLSHDQIEYFGTYSAIGANDQAGEATTLRLATVRNNEWWSIGGVGTLDFNGSITSTASNTELGHVALANSKNGKNRLGKGDVVAAFDALSACVGSPVNFTNNSAAINGVLTTYRWNFGDTSVTTDTSSVANPTYTFSKAGDYNVKFYVVSDLGASDTVYKVVSVYARPNVGFMEVINCYPLACQFTDTSSIDLPNSIDSYTWTIDTFNYSSTNVSHNFDTTGSYNVKLVIKTAFGCNDSLSKTIFHGDTVRIDVTPANAFTICNGDTAQISATAGINRYVWNTGATTQTIGANQAQTYIVTGYNGNNCFDVDSVTLSVAGKPTADAGMDASIKFGKSTMLLGSGGGTYLWTPKESLDDETKADPLATPQTTTTYYLTVTNSIGCTDTDTVIVNVAIPELIKVPNLVTPNGDGLNDVWDLSEIPDIGNTKVSVVNRWGKTVFS
ncbi:MAG: PKD repeat protein, partial [Bacteroidia bacterium]